MAGVRHCGGGARNGCAAAVGRGRGMAVCRCAMRGDLRAAFFARSSSGRADAFGATRACRQCMLWSMWRKLCGEVVYTGGADFRVRLSCVLPDLACCLTSWARSARVQQKLAAQYMCVLLQRGWERGMIVVATRASRHCSAAKSRQRTPVKWRVAVNNGRTGAEPDEPN